MKVKNQFLQKINNLLIKIEKAEQNIINYKKQLNKIPSEISQYQISNQEKTEIANYIYWNVLEIKVPILSKDLFNLETHQFLKFIKKTFDNIVCYDCQQKIIIKSKTQYKEYIQDLRKNNKIRCKKCYEREINNRPNLWKEQEEKRKQNIEYLKKLQYSDYLKSDHWKNIRHKKLKNVEFKCQICNAEKTELHVHHNTYERKGQEYLSDLLVLCKECHNQFHDKIKKVDSNAR